MAQTGLFPSGIRVWLLSHGFGTGSQPDELQQPSIFQATQGCSCAETHCIGAPFATDALHHPWKAGDIDVPSSKHEDHEGLKLLRSLWLPSSQSKGHTNRRRTKMKSI